MSAGRVVACVVARDERLLVCQRPPGKRHGGLWEFPGGKTEVGETDDAAAARELSEELGVEVTAVGPSLFEVVDPGSDFTISFLEVEIRGEPVCLEHSAIRWATLTDLVELPLAPSDAAYVRFRLSFATR